MSSLSNSWYRVTVADPILNIIRPDNFHQKHWYASVSSHEPQELWPDPSNGELMLYFVKTCWSSPSMRFGTFFLIFAGFQHFRIFSDPGSQTRRICPEKVSPSCCAAVQGRTKISAILQEGHWTLGGNDRISEAGEFGWPIGRESDRQFEPRFFRKNVKEVFGYHRCCFFFCRRQTVYYRYISLVFYPYLCCAKLRSATIEKQSNMLFAPPMFASIYKRNFPATSCLWQKIFQEQKWTLLGFERYDFMMFHSNGKYYPILPDTTII